MKEINDRSVYMFVSQLALGNSLVGFTGVEICR